MFQTYVKVLLHNKQTIYIQKHLPQASLTTTLNQLKEIRISLTVYISQLIMFNKQVNQLLQT